MLINCFECGKEISDKAASCPHCGNPINAKIEAGDSDYVMDYRPRRKPKDENDQTIHGRNDGCFMRSLNLGLLMSAVIVGLIILFGIIGTCS